MKTRIFWICVALGILYLAVAEVPQSDCKPSEADVRQYWAQAHGLYGAKMAPAIAVQLAQSQEALCRERRDAKPAAAVPELQKLVR